MTELCFWLNPLMAGEALAVLAGDRVRLDALEQADIRLRLLEDGWCRFVVPDPDSAPGRTGVRAARRQAYDGLKAGLAAFGVVIEEVEAPEPLDERVDLAIHSALPWLLLNAGEEAGAPAPAVEGERGLLFTGVPETEVAAAYDLLRDHATNLRVMAGVDDSDSLVVACHVRADPERLETLGGLLTSGRLGEAAVLAVFPTREGLVCLPAGTAPPAASLEQFARLAALSWYGADVRSPQEAAQQAGQLFLAIVTHWVTGARQTAFIAVHLLRGLRPVEAERLHPPQHVRITVHPLGRSGEAIGGLQRLLAEADPPVGYRPTLQEAHAPELVDAEIERLGESIRLMEDRLAYLDGLRAPGWRLLRFTQAQLPGLADALRRFSPADLERGAIRYGFQATVREPAGLHYLLFRPDSAVMTDPFPHWRWQAMDPQPMLFRLDPYWARYYHDRRAQSLLFVPEGTALVPPLHSWDRGGMEDHLRVLVEAWWASGEADAAAEREEEPEVETRPIPARPLYLFAPDPARADGLTLEILDFDGFAPVHETLAWINANVELIDAVPAEELIAALADETGRSALVQRIVADGANAGASLQAAIDAARRTGTAQLGALLEDLGREIDRTIDDMHGVTGEIAAGHRNLAALNDALADAAGRAGISLSRFEGRTRAIQAYAEHRTRIEEDILGGLREARALADDLAARLQEHLDELLQARDALQQRIERR